MNAPNPAVVPSSDLIETRIEMLGETAGPDDTEVFSFDWTDTWVMHETVRKLYVSC